MPKVTISKRTLDHLIKAKLADLPDCQSVNVGPVSWRARTTQQRCNWAIPEFDGDPVLAKRCRQRMEAYLALLRAEFDIPDEPPTGPGE